MKEMYKLKGTAIGVDFNGDIQRREFVEKIDEMEFERMRMSAELPNIQVAGLMDIKLVQCDVYSKRKIDSYEWVGDIDSCLADEIMNSL